MNCLQWHRLGSVALWGSEIELQTVLGHDPCHFLKRLMHANQVNTARIKGTLTQKAVEGSGVVLGII
jgi:hypothetical protein